MENKTTKLKPIVDKLGFLKYEMEQWYCKRNGLVRFHFFDWDHKQEQYWMRLFQHSPEGQAWLSDTKNKEYIDGYCANLERVYN
jgi:hypothetical protein|tara:strand:+ start:293 stop:544 length:252 start_codon:yes stop_codon:yes gene_type:complete